MYNNLPLNVHLLCIYFGFCLLILEVKIRIEGEGCFSCLIRRNVGCCKFKGDFDSVIYIINIYEVEM